MASICKPAFRDTGSETPYGSLRNAVMALGVRVAVMACALTVLTCGVLAQDQSSGAQAAGARDYQFACAACHGMDGKGNGPMASELKTPPADLTRISAHFEGRYPADLIYKLVDGKTMPASHGTSEMPVWGGVFFLEEMAQDDGAKDEQAARERARQRIKGVIEYIRTLQD